MAKLKLTKRAVEALPAPDPSGRQQLYWAEGEYRGLGVLVSGVAATKSWVVQGKLKSRKTRRITIGPVSVFTIEEAWEEARGKLAEIYRGNDPKQTAKRKAQADITTRQVLENYLVASPNLSPSTIKTYRKAAGRHLTGWLDRPLRSISADEVETRYREIANNITKRRTAGDIKGGVNVDGRASANVAMRLLRSLWNFQAERDSDLGRNPVDRLKKQWHRLDRRDRHVRTEELPTFYRAALALPSGIQRDLVIFGLFTGMREGEAAGLRWDEVDLPQRMIRLPARRMKAHRRFDLPMSDVIYDLLVARRALGIAGEFVFPGSRHNGKSGHCESFTFALKQIGAATDIRVSPHDLRRTFASVAESAEISPLALKLLVAHSTGNDVTAGYTIMSPARLREAAQKVAYKLKELCGISMPEADDKVARIRVPAQ
jgi:integrase